MKKQLLRVACFGLLLTSNGVFAQESINAAGASVTSSSGTVDYSVGQVFYQSSGTNFTSNEGVQQPFQSTVNLDEVAALNATLTVYPNPVTHEAHLKIEGLENKSVSIHLTDVNGKILQSQSIHQLTTAINTANLVSGSYFIEVFVNDQRFKTVQLIKN